MLGNPKGGDQHDVVNPELVELPFTFRKEADSLSLQFPVDVRVVDDLADQENAAVWKSGHRFIGVFDGPLDAVAEPEFLGQSKCEVAYFEPETIGSHPVDDLAAVVFLEFGTDLRAQSKALLEVRLAHKSTIVTHD